MGNIEKSYTTTLEQVSIKDDALAILDHKLAVTSPERVADYMELVTGNIETKILNIKNYVAELNSIKKDEEDRLEYIKEQSASWLENEGVKKLEGIHVSSITINDTKPKENVIIENEEELINIGYYKKTLDKTAVKQALQSGKKLEGFATLEIIHMANKIKVNKKRK